MAIDFQQIYAKIKEIGNGARERKATLENRRSQALTLLETFSNELDKLCSIVETAAQNDATLRCAIPSRESLTTSSLPPSTPVKGLTLIAADGSQIFPDSHDQVQYYVINVGAIAVRVGSGETPETFTETRLHFIDELDNTYFSESQIALQRDVAERRKLLEISRQYQGVIIAITDGQLELWGAVENEHRKEFEKSLQDYLDVLDTLRQKGIITSGYVDRPGANWVTRLLEIASRTDGKLDNLKKQHPLAGVTDRWIFGQILPAQARSAIFALQSNSSEIYTDSLALHFFYLNIGYRGKPIIVRVDVPAWVASEPKLINALHNALVSQAEILGHKPFPYVLHRAHELALVSKREKDQIDQLLTAEIRNNSGELDEISGKKSAKDLPGRKRY